MNKGESVVEDFLREIKRHFYRDEKTFFQQRRMLIKALMLPARWLDKSNAFLAEEDYRKLLDHIVSGIRKYGDLATVRHFGVYFLDCVQRHIKHHGEEYLDHAKGLQAKQRQAMNQIVQGLTVTEDLPTSPSTEHLAELNRLLSSPGRRSKNESGPPRLISGFSANENPIHGIAEVRKPRNTNRQMRDSFFREMELPKVIASGIVALVVAWLGATWGFWGTLRSENYKYRVEAATALARDAAELPQVVQAFFDAQIEAYHYWAAWKKLGDEKARDIAESWSARTQERALEMGRLKGRLHESL